MLFPALRTPFPQMFARKISVSVRLKAQTLEHTLELIDLGSNKSRLCDFGASGFTSLGLVPSFRLLKGINELVPERP